MAKNVVVVGTQWGDEGKGKIVDWLTDHAQGVVRFQGGHNAGHTLVIDGTSYKLALLPSGVVQGKPSIIGNGVVVDPWHLVGEIEKIVAQGVAISPDILTIADNACLILLGVFPLIVMFLITSITMQRERVSGTLERILTTPLRRLDLLAAYGDRLRELGADSEAAELLRMCVICNSSSNCSVRRSTSAAS